ncbi:DinB family protein [Maribacter sp. 2307ULW6-5]|uniref:DinB family protein n=1 Tax=Maribacter sp. 2307ULW6-5 TaxID=3386275 RepID=UPI0039BCC418
MKNILEFTRQHRKNLLNVLDHTDQAMLHKVPKGYNNNIWWNVAHTVVTQQLLVHKLSGLPMQVSSALVERYKKGTFPQQEVSSEEIENVRELLLTTLDWTETGLAKGQFTHFTPYTTSARVTLTSVEDAVCFNLFHEGLHLGSILALRKALGI